MAADIQYGAFFAYKFGMELLLDLIDMLSS
jgi:hypothetical protein